MKEGFCMYSIVKCGTLIDGTGAEPTVGAALLLKDGLIVSSGKYEEVAKEAPAGAELIDYGDKYVTPGIIDAHVHVTIDPEADFTGFVGRDSDTRIAHRGTVNLKKTLDGGVTFIRDLGGYHHIDIELKKLIDEGLIEG